MRRPALRLAVPALVLALSLAPAGCQIEQSSGGTGASLPVYSPDGRWITFTSDRTGQDEIYVAREGAAASRITHSEHGAGSPAWSPDGARVVFSSLSGTEWPDPGSEGLFVVDRDGSGLRRVTAGDDYSPCFAADGKTIAFARGGDVYTVGTDGGRRRRLALGASAPACSPARPEIAVVDGGALRILDLDGRSERRIAPADAYEVAAPAWSLDGGRIAFEASRQRQLTDPVIEEGPWAAPWYFTELYVADAGGEIDRLTTNSVGDRWPSWTPDGRILFVSNRAGPDDSTNSEASELYVMNADGSGVERFSWEPEYS